jgi:regulator of replication initiation timing
MTTGTMAFDVTSDHLQTIVNGHNRTTQERRNGSRSHDKDECAPETSVTPLETLKFTSSQQIKLPGMSSPLSSIPIQTQSPVSKKPTKRLISAMEIEAKRRLDNENIRQRINDLKSEKQKLAKKIAKRQRKIKRDFDKISEHNDEMFRQALNLRQRKSACLFRDDE